MSWAAFDGTVLHDVCPETHEYGVEIFKLKSECRREVGVDLRLVPDKMEQRLFVQRSNDPCRLSKGCGPSVIR